MNTVDNIMTGDESIESKKCIVILKSLKNFITFFNLIFILKVLYGTQIGFLLYLGRSKVKVKNLL